MEGGGEDRDPQLWGRAAALGKKLRDNFGATLPEVHAHYTPTPDSDGWNWWASDWRGLRGQHPTPAQVRETWGKWDKVAAAPSRMDGVLNYIEGLRHGESAGS